MPQPGSTPPNPFLAFLPLYAMLFLIFYVLVWRPQTKARKDHASMLKNLKKHDEVATTGGILGTVVNIKEDAVTLRLDENVRVEVEKSAITRVIKSKSHAT